MMIYAGYHCRQLATAYVTVSRKLVVVFQKIPASKWRQASVCIFKVIGKGEHDVSGFNFEAKY